MDLLPRVKLGTTRMYVYWQQGFHHFGMSGVAQIDGNGAIYNTSPGVQVIQAFNLDQKTDDGVPQSGIVVARYADCCGAGTAVVQWAGPNGNFTGGPCTTATAPSSTTCYDNGNTGGAAQQYSLSQDGGSGRNCGMSVRFQ